MGIKTKKRCKKCGQLKVVTEFEAKGLKQCVMQYGNICNECVQADISSKASKTKAINLNKAKKVASTAEDSPYKRTCRVCGQVKSINEFYKDRVSNGIQRYRRECKECAGTSAKERTKLYNARKASLTNDLTSEQWQFACNYFDNSCAYCGGPVEEQEHVIPVSKGGGYTASNILPACKRCNGSKGGQDMLDWYTLMPFFKTARLAKIVLYIEHVLNE